MAVRHGTASWPGAKGCISCTYTSSQGISPGIATLEIPEQDIRDISSFGTLIITDGVGTVRLARCRVADITYNATGSTGGRTVSLHIADRRWMWSFGNISGNWNQRDAYPDPDSFPPEGEFFVAPGQPFAPGTFRPARLMMADCLAAMNETNPLIDPAPDTPVPVQWDNEVPAQALESLADILGYRVCLQVNADRVLVAPLGVGKPLWTGGMPVVSQQPGFKLPQRPAAIYVTTGRTIFNDRVALEPVGLEPNGEIRHIDRLSYRPAGGWAAINPMSFWEVVPTDELTHAEARDLAIRCVWKMFRVKMVDVVTGRGPGPNIPGFGVVGDRKQIVLLPNSYGTSKTATGELDTSPPFVTGSVYMPTGAEWQMLGQQIAVNGNTDPGSGVRLPRPPMIDTARGLVTFARQCYTARKVGAVMHFFPPELYLFTGLHIRSQVGQVYATFTRGGVTDGLIDMGCPAEYARHPELAAIITAVRRDKDRAVVEVQDNLEDVIAGCDHYGKLAQAKYEVGESGTTTYAGIIPFDCDGAISQISWRVGPAGAFTTASRNTEHDPYLPGYAERRRNWRAVAFDSKRRLEDLGRAVNGAPGASPGAILDAAAGLGANILFGMSGGV